MGFFSSLFGRLTGRKRRSGGEDFLSLVFLLEKRRPVDAPEVTARIARHFQRRLRLPEAPAAHSTPLGEAGAVRGSGVVWEGLPFAVMSVEGRYCPEPPPGVTRDLRLLRLFERHTGWIAVDWMMPATNEEERTIAYQAMGAVLAEYGGDDVLLVYDKEGSHLVPYDPSVPERLRSDHPRAVFEGPYVPIIAADDDLGAELAAAGEVARSRFPEFVGAFERRTPGQVFSVKTDFREGTGDDELLEWMWVDVEDITADTVSGRVGNEPGQLKTFKLGDRVNLPWDRVADWMYASPDTPEGYVGGFSVKLFQERG